MSRFHLFVLHSPYQSWGVVVFLLISTFSLLSQEIEREIFSPYPRNHDRRLVCDVSYNIPISSVIVGDLMMGGSAFPVIKQNGPDYPFEPTRSILQKADFAIANLEAPFTLTGKPFAKTFTFRVPPEWAGSIRDAGFDVLTLANNHVLDFGPEGLFSTMAVLDSLGMAYCGAGANIEEAEKAAIIEQGRWKIGFLAYSLTYPTEFWATPTKWGTVYPDTHRLKNSLQMLSIETDLVVVSFHWGGELRVHPKAYQRFYAHQAIDWGADLIIGHHPHVLQGLELYRDRLIAYSLGNFVFGSYSQKARDSIILRVRYDRLGLLLAEVIPISVYNSEVQFQPQLLKGQPRERIIQTLNTLSIRLNGGREILRKSGLIVTE